uniref:Amino acid permease/ SLC12A domain-containing protein n=1 Tax=Pyrodinium bahamense TaxID=73915 RepID=A0A7S0AM74_9DINO
MWHGRESASKIVRRWNLGAEEGVKSAGMGILQGVVFPCMANILGVLLFLRLPWIIGKAGILHGFLLVFICCCCTFVTALSLSAVATNGKIAGGGSYYLISRSLGPALGAGVGLCFYMANSIGAAMYFMGTVEAWEIAAPSAQIIGAGELNNIRVTGFCILGVALVVVGGGIKYVARLGTVFLFIVLGVILCMMLGCLLGPLSSGSPYTIESADSAGQVTMLTLEWSGPSASHFVDNFGADYNREQKAFPLDTHEYNFIGLMALWFPAVTGIMAGSNRSADLADPSGSIPKGTLIAQGFTSFIYLSFAVLYGCIAPRETLLDDKFFASSSAWPVKEIAIYGVIASTIGAGLTSLVSGTRLLSAIAADKTLPILKVFAVEPGKEPRLALIASGVLSACAIAIGELNAVAPVLTMFFLMCYTCVNMSCTVLEAVSDPNWRPSFRYHHWSISLVGAILCVWMMFAISAIIAMAAIVFCTVIFAYASFNSHKVKWGDGFQGLKFQIARNILQKLDYKAHTKNWRPQLLVITEASIREEDAVDGISKHEVLDVYEPQLLSFASQLKGGRGITILGGICSSEGVDVFSEGGMFVSHVQQRRVLDGQEAMQNLLKTYSIEGFGRMVYTEDYSSGLFSLMQIAGLGAFQPNCILAAWPPEWSGAGQQAKETRSRLIRMVQVAVVFNKVMLLAKGETWPQLSDRLNGHIDIWWIVGDGGILLLLPFLLAKHRVWHHCRTRLFVLAEKVGDDPEQVRQETQTYVNDFRLNIEVFVQVVDLETLDDLAEGEAEKFDDHQLQRVRSGVSLSEGLSGWRRQVSPGDSVNSQPVRQASFVSSLMRNASRDAKAFPANPPGTIGSTMSPPPTIDAVFGEPAAAGVHKPNMSQMRMTSDPARIKSAGVFEEHRGGLFMHNAGQLTSAKPCSPEQLGLARGLNALIRQQSCDADLVVTNLPDIPEGESAYGYFQLVEAMTHGLKRCVLARGTSAEVITAFT